MSFDKDIKKKMLELDKRQARAEELGYGCYEFESDEFPWFEITNACFCEDCKKGFRECECPKCEDSVTPEHKDNFALTVKMEFNAKSRETFDVLRAMAYATDNFAERRYKIIVLPVEKDTPQKEDKHEPV